jgi:SAM-dependent methyltransferase
MKLRRALAALALGLAVAACTAGRPQGGPDILFVATPEGVGLEMLRAARVGRDDVVYDLGSGDGRLVVAAARDFGARAVGVEIDAALVQDSRDAALRAGVADRARFLWQDLFATDIAEATVVTLYLRDDVNLRLRPKLLRELRPGTRVVSHDFGMADWRPDRVLDVRGPDRTHVVYLWIVPARVEGTWRGRAGEQPLTLTLRQRFQDVTGTAVVGNAATPVEGRLEGARLTLGSPRGEVYVRADGRVTGAAAGGEVRLGDGAAAAPWTATRD